MVGTALSAKKPGNGKQVEASPEELAYAERLLAEGRRVVRLDANERARFIAGMRAAVHIYFVMAEGTGMVKVGKSNRPKTRVRDMQIGCPVRLRLLFTFLGNHSTETALHRYLLDSWSHGEWFRMDERVLELMEVAADHGAVGVYALLEGRELPPKEALA